MTRFAFTVPGQPIPKARARTVRTRRGGTMSYTPDSTVSYARKVAFCARAAGVETLRGPLGIQLIFFRAGRARVDFDNLAKGVTDPLVGIAYEDDSQIDDAKVLKRTDNKAPRVEVLIWEMDVPTKGET